MLAIYPLTEPLPKKSGLKIYPIAATFHRDTLDWRDRAVADGGLAEDVDLIALNPFVEGIYDLGLRSRVDNDHIIFEFLPLAGANLNSSLTKLWYPSASSKNVSAVNFLESDYSRSTGLKGDGFSKYLNSNVNLVSFGVTNSVALSVYNRTPGAFDAVEIGVEEPVSDYKRLFLQVRYSDSVGSFDCFHYTSAARAGIDMALVGGSTGFILGSRLTNTDSRFFKNGAQIASTNSVDGSTPDSNLTYFAANNANYPTGSPRALGLIMVCGAGIAPNLVAPLNTLVQNMMAALGRAV